MHKHSSTPSHHFVWYFTGKKRVMNLCFFQTTTQTVPCQMSIVESSCGCCPSDWQTFNEFSTNGLNPPWLDTCTKLIQHAQKVKTEIGLVYKPRRLLLSSDSCSYFKPEEGSFAMMKCRKSIAQRMLNSCWTTHLINKGKIMTQEI